LEQLDAGKGEKANSVLDASRGLLVINEAITTRLPLPAIINQLRFPSCVT
jgi:hypothetical protein